jgi:hypothetical protein
MTPVLHAARVLAARPRYATLVDELICTAADIREIWSIGHDPSDVAGERAELQLLAFASEAVLRGLRKCDRLHDDETQLLVVVDGENFVTAWGPANWSGSLARWAWHETSPGEAYYDESRWARSDGSVMRVRRRALRVWPRGE